ncbi:MAG: NAD(P)H-binding protein [Candidatus Thermoplasmatota archaeon]|jgi:uncharacterized protein YbjT (DUF2867 family)
MRQAVVAGGTGLVGGHVLDELAAWRVPTLAVARNEGAPRPGIRWQRVDLAALTAKDIPPGTDAAFCCLGTTIKVAGSQAEFRRVDHDLVLAFAAACREAGVPQLHVVSAAGADPRSRIFYSRVKGETECDLEALGFPTLALYRPSLLDGQRTQSRAGEGGALAVARLLRPILPAGLRPVAASAVARAMVRAAQSAPEKGVMRVSSKQIARAGS